MLYWIIYLFTSVCIVQKLQIMFYIIFLCMLNELIFILNVYPNCKNRMSFSINDRIIFVGRCRSLESGARELPAHITHLLPSICCRQNCEKFRVVLQKKSIK